MENLVLILCKCCEWNCISYLHACYFALESDDPFTSSCFINCALRPAISLCQPIDTIFLCLTFMRQFLTAVMQFSCSVSRFFSTVFHRITSIYFFLFPSDLPLPGITIRELMFGLFGIWLVGELYEFICRFYCTRVLFV